jgi:hypothetical protein
MALRDRQTGWQGSLGCNAASPDGRELFSAAAVPASNSAKRRRVLPKPLIASVDHLVEACDLQSLPPCGRPANGNSTSETFT